ncbi:hypothetical protein K8R20_02310 [bacterium]|nr:hypothetical protein [bacterium]
MGKKNLSWIWKNLLVIVVSAIGGGMFSIVYGIQVWFPVQMSELSGLEALFGVVPILLVTVILFGLLGLVVGGIIGIVVYQIIRLVRK